MGHIVFYTFLSLFINKLEQRLQSWAVLSWVWHHRQPSPQWRVHGRVQLCQHTRTGQKWNTWSAGGVRCGAWSLVLAAPQCFWGQCRDHHWYPSTHWWSGEDWKSQNRLKHQSWGYQCLWDGIMTFTGEVSSSFLVTLSQLWGFFTVNES